MANMDEIRREMHKMYEAQIAVYAEAYHTLQMDAVGELKLELTVGEKKFNLNIFHVEVLAGFVDFLDQAQDVIFSEIVATDPEAEQE